jgi:2-desacetyl-2-hydroxyethyl bacteriochlorophyllide A dehydrogenase
MKARAVLFTGENQVLLDWVNVPEPGPGEVLVEAAYTCISPGTELRCLAGQQEGAAACPFIPGYCLSGRIVAAGANTSLKEGMAVFCSGTSKADRRCNWGGHISHAVVGEAAVFPLPENVGLLEASASRLAAIAYHGVRLAHTLPHEKVAVVGLGPIGQFSARLYAVTGAQVVGADLLLGRVEAAREAGIEAVVAADGLAQAFAGVFPGGADVVVDTTGAPQVLAEAVELGRDLPWDDSLTPSPRYVIQGAYAGGTLLPLPIRRAFLKELNFVIPCDMQPRDLRTVLDLMHRRKLQVRDVISDVRSPEDAPRTYAQLRGEPGALLTVAFGWQ